MEQSFSKSKSSTLRSMVSQVEIIVTFRRRRLTDWHLRFHLILEIVILVRRVSSCAPSSSSATRRLGYMILSRAGLGRRTPPRRHSCRRRSRAVAGGYYSRSAGFGSYRSHLPSISSTQASPPLRGFREPRRLLALRAFLPLPKAALGRAVGSARDSNASGSMSAVPVREQPGTQACVTSI